MLIIWILAGLIAIIAITYCILWFRANIEYLEVEIDLASSRELSHSALTELNRLFSKDHWWRGVLHFHTTVSPDSKGTFEEARTDARKLGLDFLISTDHDRMPKTEEMPGEGSPPIIVGQEVFAQHSSGSLIAWNITEGLPSRTYPQPKLHELVKNQGGVDVLIHHPNPKYNRNRYNLPECVYDGFEIINVYDLAIVRPFKVIINWLAALPWMLIGKETDNLLCIILDKSRNKYDEISQQRRCTLIGGTDTHIYRRWGKFMLPTYRQGFNLVQNWVYHDSINDIPTAKKIASSFISGRWIVNFYPQVKSVPQCVVVSSDGKIVGLVGDNIEYKSGLKLFVKSPSSKIKTVTIVYCNGKQIYITDKTTFLYNIINAGVYRVEINRILFTIGKRNVLRSRPWIVFNSLYIK